MSILILETLDGSAVRILYFFLRRPPYINADNNFRDLSTCEIFAFGYWSLIKSIFAKIFVFFSRYKLNSLDYSDYWHKIQTAMADSSLFQQHFRSMPALGRNIQLGDLYDYHADRIVQGEY